MKPFVKISAAAVIALTLAGCSNVPVESPNGEGFCDSDPVSLSVSQDSVGNNIQIDYTGPSDVSLLMHRLSFYFDFDEYLEANEDLVMTVEDDTPAILKLDPTDSGWTISSVAGGLVNWAFDGNIEQLFVDAPAGYLADIGPFNYVTPSTIAVSCDSSISSTTEFADADPGTAGIIDGLDIAVAQALYPRHSAIDTVEIVGQEIDGDNLVIDFEFAPGTADRFYDFDLGGGNVMIVPIDLPEDFPQIGNDTFDGAWFNFSNSCFALLGDPGPYCSTSAGFDAWSFDGSNEWVIPDPSTLIDGEYLGVFLLVDDPNDPGEARFAFTSFTYDSVNGFAIQDLSTLPREDDEKLAPTGGDPNVVIWAVLGGLVVMAAFALRPRRREVRIEE